jgi:hypothetical protein
LRPDSSLARADYQALHEKVSVADDDSHGVDAGEAGSHSDTVIAAHPPRNENSRLRIIGIKCYLDGGMLTGRRMREPWG